MPPSLSSSGFVKGLTSNLSTTTLRATLEEEEEDNRAVVPEEGAVNNGCCRWPVELLWELGEIWNPE